MALAKRLSELQRATVPRNRLHVVLWDTFVQHGVKASTRETLNFLSELRRSKDDFFRVASKSTDALTPLRRKWVSECTNHEGFDTLRKQHLTAESLQEMSNQELSRLYNLFQRMNLYSASEAVWPQLSARISSGRMIGAQELLGVWTVAPNDCLPELDAKLTKAMASEKKVDAWQLVSVITRTKHGPKLQAIKECASQLQNHVPSLALKDLASVVSQTGPPLREGTDVPDELRKLVSQAKAELLSRDGALEAAQLVGMLGDLESLDDPVWGMVRHQLQAKLTDLTEMQILAVCDFIHRASGKAQEGELWKAMMQQLQRVLNQHSQPLTVSAVSKRFDLILDDRRTCQSLMNAAVRMRKDVFPTVLWDLFVRASEAELLLKHPGLQDRMKRCGEILEQHGIQKEKMTLKQMVEVAQAMRKNHVLLEKCTAQMAEQFMEVYTKTEGEAPSKKTESEEALENSWLGMVQALMVRFCIHTQACGASATSPLDNEVLNFTSSGGTCRMTADALVDCIEELQQLGEVAQAKALLEGLSAHLTSRLPAMSQQSLVRAAGRLAGAKLWSVLAEEVGRRLFPGPDVAVHALRRGADLDELVVLLKIWGARAREVARRTRPPESTAEDSSELAHLLASAELAQRVALLVGSSLPSIMRREPEEGPRRFAAVVNTVSSFEQGASSRSQLLPALRECLHMEATKVHQWDLAETTDLAFAFAALHSPAALPFDVVARLSKLLGRAALNEGQASSTQPRLASSSGAKCWAFTLSLEQLCSSTVNAALRISDEAPVLKELLTDIESRKFAPGQSSTASVPRFALHDEPSAVETVQRLRAALPKAWPEVAFEGPFTVPHTPYVVDFALRAPQQVLLVVPRGDHRGVDHMQLSGHGRLMQVTLEAMGWTLHWVWPEFGPAALVEKLREIQTPQSADDRREVARKVAKITGDAEAEGSGPRGSQSKGDALDLAPQL